MEQNMQEVLLFFDGHMDALPLYLAFQEKVEKRFPESGMRVQKTQITFYNRHVFACVSFARVLRKAQMPENCIVVTLGLPYALSSERVAVRTEPYPGRWTTHFVIGRLEELDDEFMGWVEQAYGFAQAK